MDEKCKSIEERLTEYIYNELPENLKAEFDMHINSCEKCRLEVEEQRKILSLFQDMKVDFSEDVWHIQRQMIMRKLETEKKGLLELLRSNIAIRRLGYAFIILFFIGVSAFAYIRHIMYEKDIVKNLEMFQNIDVIEELEILEHMADNGDNT